MNVNGIDIPVYIICGSAYPLSTFSMKPFDHNTTHSPDINYYNYRLSIVIIISENAFGQKQGDVVL